MIKISFSGFSGSGKTSLLAEVKKILSLKSRVESIDENKGKNPFDDDKRSSFVSQFFEISSQINEENIKSQGTTADYLLCDQSVLDHWVYWKNSTVDKEYDSLLREKENVLFTLFRFWIKTYHLVFLIRMDLKELEKRELNNELRIADIKHIKRVEELYKKTVEGENLKVIEIWNNNSIDESAHEILKHISAYIDKEREKGIEKPDETLVFAIPSFNDEDADFPGHHSPDSPPQS